MRAILAVIMIALAATGCVAKHEIDPGSDRRLVKTAAPSPEPNKPPAMDLPDEQPISQAPTEAEVFIYPSVPRHPAASGHHVESDQRVSMTVKGATTGEILGWYRGQLEARGWKTVATVLPPGQALLFSYEGRYMSVVGHDIAMSQVAAALIWFQQRSSPEVTQAGAQSVASNTHRLIGPDQWTPSYHPDYETNKYGLSVRHPVWVLEVKSPRSSVTVWVDAITAEAFQVRQACDY